MSIVEPLLFPEPEVLSPEDELLVSVVIPCLNEAANIERCVTWARTTLAEHGIRGEVVVADNDSEDESAALALAAGARLVCERRRGYGNAYMAGFAAAKGRYVVMADADLTYDFGEIPRFLEELENGADLVMGDRMDGIQPGAMPWLHRYIGNPILSGTLNLFFKTGVRDAHCGMRAFRRDKLPLLDLRTTGMEFASEMVIRAAKADLIVTVGGGSITDGAKAVQLCLANDIRNPEDIDRIRAGRGASPQLAVPTVRQISVPTTIAGGEFSATAGVTNEKTKVKEALRHPLLMPRAVILDPWLGAHTPEWLWLSTGIRAVDHCVEGICSREAHPYGDAQALKGLSMLAQALPRVKADAKNLDARMDCQIGTWLSTGPLASGVPMGASHGIGYVLGAEFGVPHGYTSCVMLPSVMRWNKPANAERQALVAAAMGHPNQDAGSDGNALGAAQPAQDRGAGTGARDS